MGHRRSLELFRLATTLFVAWSMALAVCHLFQLAPRMAYDAAEWRSTQSMYANFGPPWGAIVEGGAWVGAMLLAFFVRGRGRSFWWTLACAVAMIVAQGLWWTLVRPVNEVMTGWTVGGSIPDNWETLRAQWEYTHAVRAAVQTFALLALVKSFTVETRGPEQNQGRPSRQDRSREPLGP